MATRVHVTASSTCTRSRRQDIPSVVNEYVDDGTRLRAHGGASRARRADAACSAASRSATLDRHPLVVEFWDDAPRPRDVARHRRVRATRSATTGHASERRRRLAVCMRDSTATTVAQFDDRAPTSTPCRGSSAPTCRVRPRDIAIVTVDRAAATRYSARCGRSTPRSRHSAASPGARPRPSRSSSPRRRVDACRDDSIAHLGAQIDGSRWTGRSALKVQALRVRVTPGTRCHSTRRSRRDTSSASSTRSSESARIISAVSAIASTSDVRERGVRAQERERASAGSRRRSGAGRAYRPADHHAAVGGHEAEAAAERHLAGDRRSASPTAETSAVTASGASAASAAARRSDGPTIETA